MSPATSKTERIARSCPICEASCGLVMQVDRARKQVLSVEGDAEDPRSRGYLCPKALAPKAVYEDPDRLRRPIRRAGDRWKEISWDEAFDLITRRVNAVREKHGKNALGIYVGNPTGHNLGAMLWTAVFIQSLDTERLFTAATVDQFPKNLSCRCMYGDSWLFPIPDLDRTEYFLCLGANPLVSQGSLMSAPNAKQRLHELRARGGKLVVVDPRRTETAEAADEHLFIKPGSDAFWLFAIVHVLFAEGMVRLGRLAGFTDGVETIETLAREFSPEAVASVTGIEPETTRRIAREFARADRAVCYGRQGTCTVEFGSLTSWLVDVVNVLTSNLDRPGGAMFPRPATGQSEPVLFDSGPVPYGRFRSRVRRFPEFDGQLPVAVMAEEIEAAGEDRVRAMITVAGNPVLSTPNGARLSRALDTVDFMVSVDIYLNETTRHADVILPTRVHLEEANFDFLFQSTSVRNMVRYSPRIFDPEPDSKAHWEVLAELCARLGGSTRSAFEDFMLEGALGMITGQDGPCEGASPESLRSGLTGETQPERMLDLLLRAGPYGDHFDEAANGISLTKIAAVPHAVDLGPLEPRLPDVLKTPGRRLQLAHEVLVRDVQRLRRRLGASSNDRSLLLIGRRQLRDMNSWLHNLEVLASGRPRCTLLVHPHDADRLGLRNGKPALVRSRVGEVEAVVEIRDEMMPGVVSLPHGFGHRDPGTRLRVASKQQPGVNANQLADELLIDELSGTSVVNGVPVEVSPSSVEPSPSCAARTLA